MFFTSCSHIVCASCRAEDEACKMCSKSCKHVAIGPGMPQNIADLFRNPKDLAAEVYQKLLRVVAFQKFHRERIEEYDKRANTMRTEHMKKANESLQQIAAQKKSTEENSAKLRRKLEKEQMELKALEERLAAEEKVLQEMKEKAGEFLDNDDIQVIEVVQTATPSRTTPNFQKMRSEAQSPYKKTPVSVQREFQRMSVHQREVTPSLSRRTSRDASSFSNTISSNTSSSSNHFANLLASQQFRKKDSPRVLMSVSRRSSAERSYNPQERPVRNASQALVVKIKLFLQQILDVDEQNQIVSVNAWLSYTWFDYKLQWDPEKYGGIQDVRFPGSSDHIWKPDILLYNSAAEDFDSTYKSNLVAYNTGNVVWIPPGVLKFVCQLDVTWFPFDDQICEMKFGSWTFHGYAIDLQIDDAENSTNAMDLSTFLVNGEWIVVDSPAERQVNYFKCCPEPYPTVKYFLHIRRRTLYYGFNLIIPSLLISLMAILGFMFPPDGGEKITLEVTILLAIVFFLSMVSEMTPPTSEAVPLIGVFFSCCMLVVSASVVFTIVVLNLHFRTADSHVMSPVIKHVLLEFLPWLLCMSRPGYEFVRGSAIDKIPPLPKAPESPLRPDLPTHHPVYEAQVLLLQSIHKELRKVVAFYTKEEKDEQTQQDWRFAAMVVDRACLIVFTFFIVLSILAIILSAPHLIA
ncbi:unnamed protein product [Caenorhabditis auriculariae]|uniref:Uncharacterized protein n=1 Tax=Caenorhabditis auriculariae TaxID=2777116 RepID=A0A8S1HI16_9PELO|nr:unnamed protein product [Caenorhabditis auriculariae]